VVVPIVDVKRWPLLAAVDASRHQRKHEMSANEARSEQITSLLGTSHRGWTARLTPVTSTQRLSLIAAASAHDSISALCG